MGAAVAERLSRSIIRPARSADVPIASLGIGGGAADGTDSEVVAYCPPPPAKKEEQD